MIRKILPIILIFCFSEVFAQKELVHGVIVLESKDSISGKIENKNYYSADKVVLFNGEKNINYPKKVISEIHINSDFYVKSNKGIWSQAFFKKEVSGNVNLYTYKRRKKLGISGLEINTGRLHPSIKLYCDDYPYLKESLKTVDKKNVDQFITEYNAWKQENPLSKSFYERNIHNKPLVNIKLSFLLPGAGIEIGLSDNLSFSSMLKNDLYYSNIFGFELDPFIDSQLRYFPYMTKNERENKRTYKYTGYYVALVNGYYLGSNSGLMGVEYGWQKIINKHWYFNAGIGAGKWTGGNKNFVFLHDFDFGFNF